MIIKSRNYGNHIFGVSNLKMLYGMVFYRHSIKCWADNQAFHMVIVPFSSVRYANEVPPLFKNTYFTISLEVLI